MWCKNKTVPEHFREHRRDICELVSRFSDKIAALNALHVLPDHRAPGDGSLVAQEKAFIGDCVRRARPGRSRKQGVPVDDAGKQLSTGAEGEIPRLAAYMNVAAFGEERLRGVRRRPICRGACPGSGRSLLKASLVSGRTDVAFILRVRLAFKNLQHRFDSPPGATCALHPHRVAQQQIASPGRQDCWREALHVAENWREHRVLQTEARWR